MELNIVNLILGNFEPTAQEQERLLEYLRNNKEMCEEYISSSLKYKERVICLKALYRTIMADLLADISRKINS